MGLVLHRHTTADALLQALDESVVGPEVRGVIAHRWQSVIPPIALLEIVMFRHK